MTKCRKIEREVLLDMINGYEAVYGRSPFSAEDLSHIVSDFELSLHGIQGCFDIFIQATKIVRG